MCDAWIEGLEGRRMLSVAPMGGAQLRAGAMVGAGDVIQQRDRLRDGSCQTATATTTTSTSPIRLQKHLQDGSCKL